MIETNKPFFSFFKECQPGYYDNNCSKMCEYPTFGEKCAQRCPCEKDLCNFIFGCTNCKYIYNYLSEIHNNFKMCLFSSLFFKKLKIYVSHSVKQTIKEQLKLTYQVQVKMMTDIERKNT